VPHSKNAIGLGDAQRSGCAIDLDAGQCAALRCVGGADPGKLGRRKLDAGAIEADELAAAAAQRQRVDIGRQVLSVDLEIGPRPGPAIKTMGHCTGDAVLCMCARRDGGEREWGEPGRGQLSVLPARRLPLRRARILQADAP
jgi:hypothetical protein